MAETHLTLFEEGQSPQYEKNKEKLSYELRSVRDLLADLDNVRLVPNMKNQINIAKIHMDKAHQLSKML
jgi:hypothetical protein